MLDLHDEGVMEHRVMSSEDTMFDMEMVSLSFHLLLCTRITTLPLFKLTQPL